MEELSNEEQKLEKNIEYEKERKDKIRKIRIKKEFDSSYIHSISLHLSPNALQGINGLAYQHIKKTNPYDIYVPNEYDEQDNSNRNISVFASYFYLPKNLGIDFYSISIASNPSGFAMNPSNLELDSIRDSKRKSSSTILVYKMFNTTESFAFGIIGGLTYQNEEYFFQRNSIHSLGLFENSQEFSGWGPEIGFRLKWKIMEWLTVSNNLTFIHTENNYKYSHRYISNDYSYYSNAYSDFDNPVFRLNANNNGFAKGTLQTDGFRNFTNFDIPISENTAINFGLMLLMQRLTISNFEAKMLLSSKLDENTKNSQIINTFLFYDNIKNQYTFYNAITVGLTLKY
ncbi:hypothetical protein [Leptospira brenneri]|uniref:hypothetical protein n=1 Tax=Leptospira brenneri TaxID=2023182 RepID=UPI001AD84FD5|nr:hypothetical protein [Leptospira brenneri]